MSTLSPLQQMYVAKLCYNIGMKSLPNSAIHHLGVDMKRYVEAIMEHEGRDFTTCEYCDKDILNGKYELHHTKYEGATYYDLMIVCRSCNRIPENVGLA